ncbi:MAG TPA: YbaN family protein [Planctomycetota bacterium]|nr:YbaN family protein [Planctomycetota bacterium]
MVFLPPPPAAARALYLSGAALFFALAALGVALPGLPTTPFLLLTSWCLVRSSPRLHARLRRSPVFGPLLVDWETRRGVRLHVKVTALLMMTAAAAVAVFASDVPTWARLAIAVLAATGAFVVLRLRVLRD